MKILTLLASVLLAVAPADAQSVTVLKKQLREKEAVARGDADAMVEVAVWAEEKGLISDRKRILNNALKIDPEHAKAHDLLGFVKYDGEWMTKSKAAAEQRKALAAEMKAKGFVEVDGIWVSKEEVDDAKKGIFRHDGVRVSKADKTALSQGKVRHPVTGEFIESADLDKAEQGLYPLGSSGRWGSEPEADVYHADPQTPWLFRTHYATVISNKPIAEIREITQDLDSGVDSAKKILGFADPSPANRPVIHIAVNSDQYRVLGNEIGAEGSAYAVFQATDFVEGAGLGSIRPIVMNWDKDWGPYWIRHAAGLAYACAVLADCGAQAPLWFERGVAGYAERHFNEGVASFFGKQHLQKGGVVNLGGWFGQFEISGNLEPRMLDFNVYQAGLVLDYAMSGSDEKTTAAMQAVSKAASEGDGRELTKAIVVLEKVLSTQEDGAREHLRKITSK